MNIKYHVTKEAHEQIKRVYMTGTGNGEINILAKHLRLPTWKVSRYALHQGWIQKQKKASAWSEEEIKILERWAHITSERIQIKLKTKGFKRSLVGIILKRKRMRLLSNLKGQSASAVAMCLGVDSHFITSAIKAGLLKARKRGTDRTKQQGGDMWYISDKSIRKFIIENVHAIDLRKVDKYWYTDIVAGRNIS